MQPTALSARSCFSKLSTRTINSLRVIALTPLVSVSTQNISTVFGSNGAGCVSTRRGGGGLAGGAGVGAAGADGCGWLLLLADACCCTGAAAASLAKTD